MIVYILDTGCCGKKSISYIDPDDRKIITGDDNGHGSICNYIIKMINKDAEILNYKVLNKNNSGMTYSLIKALEEIHAKNTPGIVNLSLTTPATNHRKELRQICDALKRQGNVIFASYANDNDNGYLHEIESVISINAGYRSSGEQLSFFGNSNVTLLANKEPILVYDNERNPVFFGGNSKATAVASGIASLVSWGDEYIYDGLSMIEKYVFFYNNRFSGLRKTKGLNLSNMMMLKSILIEKYGYSSKGTEDNLELFASCCKEIISELERYYNCTFYKQFVQLNDFQSLNKVSYLMEDVLRNETNIFA